MQNCLISKYKSILREVTARCVFISTEDNVELPNHILDCILELIDTNIHKVKEKRVPKKKPECIVKVYFDNKGIQMINLGRILRQPNVDLKLPNLGTSPSETLIIVYKLCPTICSIVFNYKETIQDLNTEEWMKNNQSCDCSTNKFQDSHHKHVVTES